MREVCFILVENKILRAYFGSETLIPDLRERWEVIWAHRAEITEIAHTHPGGFLDFSGEDLSTMEAVEAGTGRQFTWSIITRTGFLSRKGAKTANRQHKPWWVDLIRLLSYGEPARQRAKPTRKGVSKHERTD